MSDAAYYRRLVYRTLARHKWILCGDVAVAFTPMVSALAEAGAPRPLVLAGSEGTGDLPDPELAEVVILGIRGTTILDGIRRYHSALLHLPQSVIDAIERWDPTREARVLPPFTDADVEIAGRPSWSGRRQEWIDAEDKTTVDEVWDGAGVPRAPSRIVPAVPDDLTEAATGLDAGGGTVWSGDNREGWHGGAEYTRFVADPRSAAGTIEFMVAHCDRVRVMPFLEGVPCSIHAMVFPDAVAAFRPVEMVVFRVPGSDLFRYAGTSTSWDPAPSMRHEMRETARRVGAHLREVVGFRGALTIDGVATADGFLPTELNPRFGAGLGPLGQAAEIPLLGISRLLVAGETEGISAEEVEAITVAAADSKRHLGGYVSIPIAVEEQRQQRVEASGSQVDEVPDGGNGTLTLGPAPMGGLVRFALDAGQATPGTQAAPVVAAAFGLADRI